jgi:CrcB protein
MAKFLWICLAGAVGTAARYLLASWLTRASGSTFPWGTIAVNLMGSFCIGLIMEVGVDPRLLAPDLRQVLTIGLMGGFTTYSSFNYETLRLTREGSAALALLNVGVTLLGCLATGLLGLWCGMALARRA